jgi:hypothetical protein
VRLRHGFIVASCLLSLQIPCKYLAIAPRAFPAALEGADREVTSLSLWSGPEGNGGDGIFHLASEELAPFSRNVSLEALVTVTLAEEVARMASLVPEHLERRGKAQAATEEGGGEPAGRRRQSPRTKGGGRSQSPAPTTDGDDDTSAFSPQASDFYLVDGTRAIAMFPFLPDPFFSIYQPRHVRVR